MPRRGTDSDSTWDGAGVVITGAAQGIGAAYADRLAAEGARLVLADLKPEGLRSVAERTNAIAVQGDCSTSEGIRQLVDRATEHLGDIDVWIGNAGVDAGQGLHADEASWDLSWQVNVLAHARAARLLIPRWLERGSGRFIVTASAAGLLTVLGSPTYAVTKHGAVAYAEWLAATYGAHGIKVHAVCPQGVQTDMLAGIDEAAAAIISADGALQPSDVAQALVDAVERETFLVLPHPQVADYYRYRATHTDKWLSGMQSLQAKLDAARPLTDR
ncbi:SDR family oxidoreductase [Leekyejoonella antrihumi]|uniref:SDR family oxidoreductase n=1 Tax=Leekyejoonella antrihumi TaxID=1660198 RepID=A0A563E4J4_9MICO|nr:SDR family oxidoreductase [Leekyejoonella antrihumi]